MHLSGGSVSLDLALSASIMRYIDGAHAASARSAQTAT
jgi:hypothetical protein